MMSQHARRRSPPLAMIESGHWFIKGRHVRAIYQGRSRNIIGWNIDELPGDPPQPVIPFATLREARHWIQEITS
jgi:hypothetical protein